MFLKYNYYIRNMKKIAYLSIIALLASCGGKTNKENPKKDNNDSTAVTVKTEQQILTENNIKIMQLHHCEVTADGKADTSKKELQEIKEFDTKGNVLKHENYFGDEGTVKTYSYNQDGKVASFVLKDKAGSVISQYDLTYENGLNTIKSIKNAKGIETTVITHKYDEKGNCISIYTKENDTTKNSLVEHKYDEKSRKIVSKTFDAKKVLKLEVVTKHTSDSTYEHINRFYTSSDAIPTETKESVVVNKNNQIISSELIENPETKVGIRKVYEYDAAGLLKGIWEYDLPENKASGYKMITYTKH